MKHFFLELSVEQIDIMCTGYVMSFMDCMAKNHTILERTSFKYVKEEAVKDKEKRAASHLSPSPDGKKSVM